MTPVTLSEANEVTYESLIFLIRESQGQLAPIIVACDDMRLRRRIIERYEAEARAAKIVNYRIVLGREPSIRAALAKLKEEHQHLQHDGEAVFTVTGAELLLRVKLQPNAAQSEIEKFYGYLQWTREGFSKFRYPIVIWVTYRILKEMSRRAPDFWSWRKAVLRFETETPDGIAVEALLNPAPQNRAVAVSDSAPDDDDEFLPPLDEIQDEFSNIKAKFPDSPDVATISQLLGRIYANRIMTGKATNPALERDAAIEAFETAIEIYQRFNRKLLLGATLNRLARFFHLQSRYHDEIAFSQKALAIFREIGDRHSEATALNNLGNAYNSLGQYQRAIEFHQQALEIRQAVSDRKNEARSLGNLGTAYQALGEYQRALEFYQQSLETKREIGDRNGEANSIGNLGIVYCSLGEYHRAIESCQQSLEIKREIGDRSGEASVFNNLGIAYCSLGEYQRAIEFYQQSLEIRREICDRKGEADTLFNLGLLFKKIAQPVEAQQSFQQAQDIYAELGLDRNLSRFLS